MSTHNLCLDSIIKKIGIPLSVRPTITILKWATKGYTSHGHVIMVDCTYTA